MLSPAGQKLSALFVSKGTEYNGELNEKNRCSLNVIMIFSQSSLFLAVSLAASTVVATKDGSSRPRGVAPECMFTHWDYTI